MPFASGGVVSAPSFFPMGGKMGLHGRGGRRSDPAAAALCRRPAGRCGNQAAAAVNVVFNVTTPDAASFRKSEAQITGMLARAVSRGTRTL